MEKKAGTWDVFLLVLLDTARQKHEFILRDAEEAVGHSAAVKDVCLPMFT